uniref:DUF4283 domain-containing protein n=1 Tax=Quercus lobata TaxID=97700 RepID=A0A7N2MQN8_QUELO
MVRTFKQLWRSTNGFRICNQKEHRVLFVFDNLGDVDRILKNQPWSFDKHLVMLQRYNSDIPVRDLVFKTMLFWVQVHDILVCFMMREVIEEICDTISEADHNGEWRNNLDQFQIRMTIELLFLFNSTLRAAPYTLAGKDVIFVPGYYERTKPRACTAHQQGEMKLPDPIPHRIIKRDISLLV